VVAREPAGAAAGAYRALAVRVMEEMKEMEEIAHA